ncbi:hypothetical protein BN1708_020582 [Verticillium longisporum]|uniref:Uncharacterized protein n=1 Tax=Verticillium longisporum TaxID=100787 RepID=A0A0G4MX03_VERLO|nr:hypothetical protein BN1708_020582 [Verticillium longisporum]
MTTTSLKSPYFTLNSRRWRGTLSRRPTRFSTPCSSSTSAAPPVSQTPSSCVSDSAPTPSSSRISRLA